MSPTNADWNLAVMPLSLLDASPLIVHHVGQAWQPPIVLVHSSILTPTPYQSEHAKTYSEPKRRKVSKDICHHVRLLTTMNVVHQHQRSGSG